MGGVFGVLACTLFLAALLLRAIVVIGQVRQEAQTSGQGPKIGNEPGTWNTWLSV